MGFPLKGDAAGDDEDEKRQLWTRYSRMRKQLKEPFDDILQNFVEDERVQSLLGGFISVISCKQTWSRYMVEHHLANKKWYNPNFENPDAPSLSKGWAYFEHFTLPRKFDAKGGDARAPLGEAQGTKLYSVFRTHEDSLSDWGIGMGMYFSSLKTLSFIFILVGCVNVANMVYYSSDKYDSNLARPVLPLLDMLQYSVICSDREWVVCAEGCDDKANKWDEIFTSMYYGTATDTDTGEEVTLISRTTCLPAQFKQGIVNYGTLILLILCMLLYMWYQGKKEVRFDEDNTTAADYTVTVHNPPPDALNPDDWRDFFEQFADKQVTLCTVALDNDRLLAKLVERRLDIKALLHRLPEGSKCDFDDEHQMDAVVESAKQFREGEEGNRGWFSKFISCFFTPLLRCLGFSLPEYVIWNRIKATTDEIRKLQREEYGAAAVYVTFETEQGQRNALKALNASEMEVLTNTAIHLDSSALFQGRVLRVEEASEPSAVRWTDLNYTKLHIYLGRLVTFFITFGLVFLSAFILNLSRLRVSTAFFSIILSTSNAIIPIIVRILVSYEKHYDNGSLQASLYLKITFFRWVNTAVITRVITPFLVTLGEKKIDLINTVNALMISEMVVAPLLRYLNFDTILKMHYFAPRATTEEELFSCFRGAQYNLAERFTDFTKVLLQCTFYSAFYPLIYFLGAGILFTQYWMDKFLLLRFWQPSPMAGTATARFSRTYFSTAALLLGAISSGYAYATSPFTMLCSCSENGKDCAIPDTQEFANVLLKNGTTIPSIQTSNETFYFCNQHIMSFPPVPRVQGSDKWMTDSQEHLSRIYGWTCLVFLVLYCIFMLGKPTASALRSLLTGGYEPTGWDQHKDFSSTIGFETVGYIPQLEVKGFNFPLLACNIDGIDARLIGWKDPNCHSELDNHLNYDDNNLIFDVPNEEVHHSWNEATYGSMLCGGESERRPTFSVVKHYPPDWACESKEKH